MTFLTYENSYKIEPDNYEKAYVEPKTEFGNHYGENIASENSVNFAEKNDQSNAKAIYSETFFKKNLEQYDVVIVDVWANFCFPCKKIAPMYEELSESYRNESAQNKIVFLKDCIDDNEVESIHSSKITAIPTFFIYVLGEVVGTIVGADFDKLKNILSILLDGSKFSGLEKKQQFKYKLDNIYTNGLLEKDKHSSESMNESNIGVY